MFTSSQFIECYDGIMNSGIYIRACPKVTKSQRFNQMMKKNTKILLFRNNIINNLINNYLILILFRNTLLKSNFFSKLKFYFSLKYTYFFIVYLFIFG